MNSETRQMFSSESNWIGGFYELAIRYSSPDSPSSDRALRCIWSTSGIRGAFLSRSKELHDQTPVDWAVLDTNDTNRLYGLIELPNGSTSVCGTIILEEDEGYWLVFYLPMAALGLAYPEARGFPFGEPDSAAESASMAWREKVDQTLASLGEAQFNCAPFSFALVGFEASSVDSVEEDVNVSEPRWFGRLLPREGTVEWVPPSELSPPFSY